MNEQRRVGTVEDFKLRIAAIISGKPEQRLYKIRVVKDGRPPGSTESDRTRDYVTYDFSW